MKTNIYDASIAIADMDFALERKLYNFGRKLDMQMAQLRSGMTIDNVYDTIIDELSGNKIIGIDAVNDYTEIDIVNQKHTELIQNRFKQTLSKDLINDAKLNFWFTVVLFCLAIALVVTLVRIVTV